MGIISGSIATKVMWSSWDLNLGNTIYPVYAKPAGLPDMLGKELFGLAKITTTVFDLITALCA